MKKNTPLSPTETKRIANQVSVTTILWNVVLSLFKLLAGIFAHSGAMISDAVHSASDVFSTFVVMIGIRLSAKKADKEHPYGHERLECVAAILLSALLFFTGLGIGADAVGKIFSKGDEALPVPGLLALVAALLSIAVKEGMYQYTKHFAKKIDSSALLADAWHHRSDSFSSIGALIGIMGARMGLPVMDPLASILIFFFIAKASFDIFRDAVDKVVDHSAGEDVEKEILALGKGVEGVLGIDFFQTRIFANKIYVDLEISVDASLSVKEAHDIAESVHDRIEKTLPKVKHIMIHVNPDQKEKA